MKYLRWLLAVAVTLYALMSALPATFTVLHKLSLLKLPEMVKSHGALMDALSWPQVILWWVAVILFLVAAWRLAFAKGRALIAYVIAYVCDVAGWLWMQGPAYDATFPAGQRQNDIIILAVMALIGVLIAWVELRRTPAN